MADNQEVALGKWEKFENELDNKDANQGQEFNQFIESRKNSTDNTSIFTSSGNQDRYKEFSRLDQESGYKGWSIDIRGKKNPTIFKIIRWVDGTNNSSTKPLMFQAFFFSYIISYILLKKNKLKRCLQRIVQEIMKKNSQRLS